MKYLFLLLLPFLALPLAAQTTETGSFEFDGLERDYLVYFPSSYTPGQSLPLVFNFHGITSTAGEQYAYTGLFGGMNTVADTGNFLVCYPNGTKIPDADNNEWNVGFSFSSSTADDVGFIDALIDTLHANYQINLDRVYATGFSNGGYFSYRLACELTNRIQAVASVSGVIVPEMLSMCDPSNSVPVLQIHGTADLVVPYNGFEHGITVDQVIEKWRNRNFCAGDGEVIMLPDTNTDDLSTIEKTTFSDCHSNRQVVLYKVNNGEHTWPGATLSLGVTNQDINASQEIWNFFNQYTEPIAVSTQDLLAEDASIQASPNPFADFINLQAAGPIQSLRVLNMMGQELEHPIQSGNEQVELATGHWAKGVYFIEVLTAQGKKTHKLIKE